MKCHPIFIVFAAAAVAASVAAPLPAADHAGPSSVERVTVIPPGMAWFLVIAPDGSAAIQYGSTFGDSARVPPGTIDFRAVVAEVVRQRTSDRVAGGTQASLENRGETSARISSLKDDRFFRDLVTSLDQKWESKGWRFDELRRSHPIYPVAGDR